MSYASTVLADSPTGYWKFNESSGTTITDYGSAGLNLTTSGSPTLGVTGPITGDTACSFVSASLQYASVADNSNVLQNGDVFTLECWYKRSATQSTFQSIMGKGTSGGARFLVDNGNHVNLTVTGGTTVYAQTGTFTDTTNWHHLVLTKNGSTVKFYLDTVDTAGTINNTTVATDTDPFLVGRKTTGLTDYLNGSIAHVAVYVGTALSSARVTAHYNAATTAAAVSDTGGGAIAAAVYFQLLKPGR